MIRSIAAARWLGLLVCSGAIFSSLPAHAQGAAGKSASDLFQPLARYEIGGDGGWDYLVCDSPGHRLFITRGSHVQVVSTDTGKLIGDIPDTKGCHGVALAPQLGRGFISDGGDDTVTIFDLKTLKVLGTTVVGKRPDAILFDPATKRVFTFNGGSSDTTALDAQTGKVVGTIALGGRPEFAVSDAKGHVWVNIEDKSETALLDPKALTVVRRTALAPAEEPSGLALDLKTHHLFAACGNGKAAVIDGNTGKLLATPAIGDGPDAANFDPALKLAFMSNGDGTLSVLKETTSGQYTTETVKTEPRARTMTLDPATHRLYLVTAKFAAPPANAPAPTNGRPPRPAMIPGSFVVLVYGPK